MLLSRFGMNVALTAPCMFIIRGLVHIHTVPAPLVAWILRSLQGCWLLALSVVLSHPHTLSLCSIPFSLAKMRGMNPGVDRFMDRLAGWMGASAPQTANKGCKHPASKSFLRGLKVTRYKKPEDLEAAAEGGWKLFAVDEGLACCLTHGEEALHVVHQHCVLTA